MNILDARWETDSEREIRIRNYNTGSKREQSDQWCAEKAAFIIDSYKEFYIQYPIYLQEQQDIKNEESYLKELERNKIFEAIKNGDSTHKCKCGGTLKYVNFYNGFIGCSNYKEPVSHTKVYPHPQPELCFTQTPNEIGKMHLNVFKAKYGLPGYVMVSSIFKVLQTYKVPLLCHLTFHDFLHGVNSSRESKIEEQMLLFRLKPKFQIVHYQKGIRFTQDGAKWQTAIPDYICYNKFIPLVKVYDCKKAVRLIDDEQLDKYTSLVDFLLKKKGSVDWKVEGRFLIFDPEDYSQEQLKNRNCISTQSL